MPHRPPRSCFRRLHTVVRHDPWMDDLSGERDRRGPEWLAAIHEAGHAVSAASMGVDCAKDLAIFATDDHRYWRGEFHCDLAGHGLFDVLVVAHAGWKAEFVEAGEHPHLSMSASDDRSIAVGLLSRDGRGSPGLENLAAMEEAERRVRQNWQHLKDLAVMLERDLRVTPNRVNGLLSKVAMNATGAA